VARIACLPLLWPKRLDSLSALGTPQLSTWIIDTPTEAADCLGKGRGLFSWGRRGGGAAFRPHRLSSSRSPSPVVVPALIAILQVSSHTAPAVLKRLTCGGCVQVMEASTHVTAQMSHPWMQAVSVCYHRSGRCCELPHKLRVFCHYTTDTLARWRDLLATGFGRFWTL
jgi:hypothetical protein